MERSTSTGFGFGAGRAMQRRPTERRALESSRRPARAFFSTEKRVAEHSGDGIFTAQKMHLKAVRLFFRARPGIEAADIRFRIGIGSSSHERLPNNYVKQRGNQRVAVFLSLNGYEEDLWDR